MTPEDEEIVGPCFCRKDIPVDQPCLSCEATAGMVCHPVADPKDCPPSKTIVSHPTGKVEYVEHTSPQARAITGESEIK
jgi:hypothetical protein